MSHKETTNDEASLRSYFQKKNEEYPLPPSLSPDRVRDRLADEPQTARKNRRAPALSAAIAAVLVLTVGIFGLFRMTSRLPVTQPNAQQPSTVRQTAVQQDASDEDTPSEPLFDSSLTAFSDHDEIRREAKKLVERYHSFYASIDEKNAAAAPLPEAAADSINGLPSAADGQTAAVDYGKTNTQVDAVDEGDILKNDGQYLYYLARSAGWDGGETPIRIIDARTHNALRIAAELSLPVEESERANPTDLYIDGDFLFILAGISERPSEDETVTETVNGPAIVYDYAAFERQTRLYVYDISDKTAPRVVRTFTQDGSYSSSRLVGGRLVFWTAYSADLTSKKTAESTCIPQTSAGALPADRIAAPNGAYSADYIVLSSLRADDPTADVDSLAVCGYSYDCYCSTDTLYLAQYANIDASDALALVQNARPELTETDLGSAEAYSGLLVYAFDVTGAPCMKGNGKVLGTPIGQFSFDEYADTLRIATTGFLRDTTENLLTVLDKDTLKPVGFLDGIAPGESLYAARFIGTTAYLVTFYQTDPLFVVDLSDPTAPTVLGELKLPGFSSYLHPIDERTLVGVGYGGDDSGTDGSVKLSLFDVSDPTAPKELATLIEPNANIGSFTHKNFFPLGKDLFAIAVSDMTFTTRYDGATLHTGAHMLLFSTANRTLTEVGRLSLEDTANGDERMTYIGDSLFLLTDTGVSACTRTLDPLCEIAFPDVSDSAANGEEDSAVVSAAHKPE